MQPRLSQYIRFLFQPFFRWWWAVITGLASLLGLFMTPDTGIILHRAGTVSLTFVLLSLLFLVLSALTQGWDLYKLRFPTLEVTEIQKNKEFGGEFVVLLRGEGHAEKGMVLELRRPIGDVEVLFALVEIRDRTSRGQYQAVPIHAIPAHQRDYFAGKFAVSQIIAVPYVQIETLRKLEKL